MLLWATLAINQRQIKTRKIFHTLSNFLFMIPTRQGREGGGRVDMDVGGGNEQKTACII